MSTEDKVPLHPAYNDLINSNDSSQNLQPPGGAQVPGSPGGVYEQTSTEVVVNPPPYTPDNTVPHRDWMIPSILASVCCFLPIALPAIYYASKANSAAIQGNVAATIMYSKYARSLVIASVVAGIFCFIIIFVNKLVEYQTADTYGRY